MLAVGPKVDHHSSNPKESNMRKSILTIALLSLVSFAAQAQPAPNGAGQTTTVDTRDNDRGFDEWGLLGLLGLLGLMGRKRRDDTTVSSRPVNTTNR
jgi:hypothetical protein